MSSSARAQTCEPSRLYQYVTYVQFISWLSVAMFSATIAVTGLGTWALENHISQPHAGTVTSREFSIVLEQTREIREDIKALRQEIRAEYR